VTPERPGSPRARLFLALDLPESARGEILAWRDGALGGRDELRLLQPEALHVTLVFLGWQYEKDVARIAATAFEPLAGLPVSPLAARALRPIPPRGPARLFALDLDDLAGGATAVQAASAEALAAAGLYEPEKRPFWPHLTLARVKRGRRVRGIEAPEPPAEPFESAIVTLYRSTLHPQGAVYEPLERHALGR
jgi:2'-5' RNA ligase